MSNYLVTDTELASVANAIRTKGGTNAQLTFPTGFVTAINNISTGGSSTPEVAADLYAANTGSKMEVTLDNHGQYSEEEQDNPSTLFSYLGANGISVYGMVANSSGNVIWKGAFTFGVIGNGQAVGGAGVIITWMEQSHEEEEEDPETGEMVPFPHNTYSIGIVTNPVAAKVYLSTVAF